MSEAQPRRGSDTRERLLDVAEASILEKGFAATSIEELIAATGITKSGFFYHFPDKGVMAKALLERYLEREEVLFDDLFARADEALLKAKDSGKNRIYIVGREESR